MESTSRSQSYPLSAVFLLILGLFLLIFPLLASYSQPKLMMSSDYLMDFYPAGKLLMEHRTAELYNFASNIPFPQSAFNHFVHQLLPDLPVANTAVYMYSPLTALVFCPYSFLTPQFSLIAWQLTSIAAFAFSIWLISKSVGQDFKKCFWPSLIYFAVFHTILIGQLGILLGLLPLALGYFFLMRKNYFASGIAWSFLLLKPQFLPIPLLITVALALNKKFRCFMGFATGLLVLVFLAILFFTPDLFLQWLSSLKISDTIFSDARYLYPSYMITSLPAAILHFFPITTRDFVKLPVYLMAFVLSLHALWLSSKIIKTSSNDLNYAGTSVFIIGIALLPLILPHFLFYDFSVFALLSILFGGYLWSQQRKQQLKIIGWLYLFSLDIYYVLLMSPANKILQPILLVIVMAFLYYRLLKIIERAAIDHQKQTIS